MTSTYEWLLNTLSLCNSDESVTWNGCEWKPCAAMRVCGHHLVVYASKTGYSAHSFMSEDGGWKSDETPSLGFYQMPMTLSELLHAIADRYDSIRAKH